MGKIIKRVFAKAMVFWVFMAFVFVSCGQRSTAQADRPNIVFILADDLGYGDLGCYGQQKFSTPHIDRLAADGILFTQNYSGSPVCAPSRATLMTGMHTGHTVIRGNKGWKPEGSWPIPDSTFTLAEMLKTKGYATGAFGKWGLGYPGSEGDPNMQGFDQFFGYNSQTLAHNYYPSHLWDNQEKVILEENTGDAYVQYAPAMIQERALGFIEQNKDKPFFLYYANIIPHAELLLPEKYLAEFRGKLLPEKNFVGAQPGHDRFRKGGYGSQPESHAAFAAMVSLLDKQVGEVAAKLKELGIEENTIIIFSSDNGPHKEGGADPDFFDSNGPLRGYKRDLYEGGIRVPMIVRWPGKIPAGTKTDHVAAFWDVAPTIAELTGAGVPDGMDGVSFLPTLLGKGAQEEHEYLYWEFHELGGRQAVRKGDWKFVRYDVSGNPVDQLFNLAVDLSEENNVIEAYPEIAASMLEIMNTAHTPSELFRFGAPAIN